MRPRSFWECGLFSCLCVIGSCADSWRVPTKNCAKELRLRAKSITFATANAPVAKLVDALDLGSSVSRRVGSSPIGRTFSSRSSDDLSLREHQIQLIQQVASSV